MSAPIRRSVDSLSVNEVVIPNDVRSFKERSETVVVRTLDYIGAELSGNVFLKSDTQGFERRVLEGAKTLMRRLCGVQLELPISCTFTKAPGHWHRLLNTCVKMVLL